ncbi:MAG: Transcriptional activator of maltose regulon, MalT [Panacagrimonas sp.]|nr:Transcriptional activator of maltose regulon, MalT [Panacagrimonas sp.]
MKRAGSRTNSASTIPRQKPLVTTRFRPPTPRGTLIQRPHLLQTLRETLSRKLALVYGPAGFGKTTLATQWYAELRAAGTSAAWLQVDAADNDLNRFLLYLVEAVRSAEPDMGEGLRELVEANPDSASDFVIDTLVNDLSVHDDHFVLFLDDWHLVREAQVHEALQLLLSRSPANLHVVVTSRTRTGVPLARLRVQNELVEIDASRLRFDYEESRTYLSDVKALDLPPEDLMALWRSTEGWAAALQLASLSLRESGNHERILQWTSGASNDISEYLAENVVDNLPPDQVRFMLETSILERLSGGLCAAVTGKKDSHARLEALERQEMFLLPLDEEREWFRYHHLFARFLQRRLQKQSPERIKPLHLAASEWFASHGYTTDAVKHALLAENTDRAVELVERHAMSLVEHSHMATLLNLVKQLPRTALFDRPRMQMAIAWAASLTHRRQEAVEALWHVERLAQTMPAPGKQLLLDEAKVARACNNLYGDQMEGVQKLVQPCLSKADRFSPWAVAVAANILAYCHLRAGEFDKVAPLMLWARAYHDRCEGIFAAVYGRCFNGLAARSAGRLSEAREMFADAVDLAARTAGRQSHAARLSGALLGQLLYEQNDLARAERLVSESRVLGFEGGAVDFYVATYLADSRLKSLKGSTEEALAILQEGEDTARALSLHRLDVAVACERVRVRLEAGDVRGAEQVLGEIDARQGSNGTALALHDEVQATIAMAKARLLCARGTAGLAAGLLNTQLETARRTGRRYLELNLRIQLAVALELDGQTADAEDTLLAVVNEAVPLGMVRSFLDEGAPLVAILERVRDRARRRGGGEAASEAGTGPFNAIAQRLLAAARHPEHGMRGPAGPGARVSELTTRETEVLKLLEQGRSNKEIARALSISVDTVKWFLKNIFTKLGVSTRAQAVSESRRQDLFRDKT